MVYILVKRVLPLVCFNEREKYSITFFSSFNHIIRRKYQIDNDFFFHLKLVIQLSHIQESNIVEPLTIYLRCLNHFIIQIQYENIGIRYL